MTRLAVRYLTFAAGMLAAVAAIASSAETPADVPPGSAGTAAPEAIAPPASGLAGDWVLDDARSDRARDKLREAMPAGGPGGRGGPGDGGGPGGRGGMGGGRGGRFPGGPGGGGDFPGDRSSKRPGGEARDGLRVLLETPPRLTIEESAETVTMRGGDGVRVLHPGAEPEGDGGMEPVARRDGARLVVESRTPHGMTVTETWEASPDRTAMTVRIRVEGGRLARRIEMLRVYVAAPPGAGAGMPPGVKDEAPAGARTGQPDAAKPGPG